MTYFDYTIRFQHQIVIIFSSSFSHHCIQVQKGYVEDLSEVQQVRWCRSLRPGDLSELDLSSPFKNQSETLPAGTLSKLLTGSFQLQYSQSVVNGLFKTTTVLKSARIDVSTSPAAFASSVGLLTGLSSDSMSVGVAEYTVLDRTEACVAWTVSLPADNGPYSLLLPVPSPADTCNITSYSYSSSSKSGLNQVLDGQADFISVPCCRPNSTLSLSAIRLVRGQAAFTGDLQIFVGSNGSMVQAETSVRFRFPAVASSLTAALRSSLTESAVVTEHLQSTDINVTATPSMLVQRLFTVDLGL